ncbi:hypothetical protein Acr_28g0008120 [Actinidia rufa]|uniref:Uncharacterized protein n=1 Tax=Actinidia rufa TaxID=165716 RepID=A0A7J0HAH5_9ERIC|nr:hypothetical protein Acr_28g0008120 [Actinidia rufa]
MGEAPAASVNRCSATIGILQCLPKVLSKPLIEALVEDQKAPSNVPILLRLLKPSTEMHFWYWGIKVSTFHPRKWLPGRFKLLQNNTIKNIFAATSYNNTSTGPVTRSKTMATAAFANRGVASNTNATKLSFDKSQSVSASASHEVKKEDGKRSEKVMATGTTTLVKQLATMARVIVKPTKTVEEKDLQIAALMNKLEKEISLSTMF